jgi:hypothetical protein
LASSLSGIFGTEGIAWTGSCAASSPLLLKPVCVRLSGFGWKSSSSWIVGSRADMVLDMTGERLSESWE